MSLEMDSEDFSFRCWPYSIHAIHISICTRLIKTEWYTTELSAGVNEHKVAWLGYIMKF